MNKIDMYLTLKEAYDDLAYLVEPVVREDIRIQRNKILEVMNGIREEDGNQKETAEVKE